MRPTQEGRSNGGKSNYMGVRRRKWGKWVSEIRLPGTQTRLWLGSYSTPEAAAVAHDTAVFYLRGPSSSRGRLNFPMCVPVLVRSDMSPQLIQKAASDAGMAIDARLAVGLPINGIDLPKSFGWDDLGTHEGSELGGDEEALDISIDDMEILF